MIVCKLKELDQYQLNLTSSLTVLKKYILENQADLFKAGKFEIENDSFFGIGLEYDTKLSNECVWEAHRKYLDVHYVLAGSEIVEVGHIDNAEVKGGYNEEHDYQFFETKQSVRIILNPGDLLLLTPEDVHKTSISLVGEDSIKKIVYKIKLLRGIEEGSASDVCQV